MSRAAAAASLILLASCGKPQPDGPPTVAVEGAVVRLPLTPAAPGAAYFTLRASKPPMRIVGVSSPQIRMVELHEDQMLEGIQRMGPLSEEAKDFGTDGLLEFEPGGRHAMLMGIDPSVRAGGTVRLVFDFDNAPDVAVDVPVEAGAPRVAQSHAH